MIMSSQVLAADSIGSLIGRRTEPLDHCRTWLKSALAVEGLLPVQRQFIDRLQQDISGIGQAREIRIGGELSARRVPVYLKDGRVTFITMAASGRVVSMPAIPLPHFDIYLLPQEWNSMRRSPLQLPADQFALPDRGGDLPPFPIHGAIRGDFEEPVGIQADSAELPGFTILPGAFAIPRRDIRETAIAAVTLRGILRSVHYRPGPRDDAFVSLPAAAAMTADWWRINSAGSREVVFLHQRNPLSGEAEYGTSAWNLYEDYLTAAETDSVHFPVEPLLMDPVLDVAPPCGLEGFATLLQQKFMPQAGRVRIFENHGAEYSSLEQALRRDGVIFAGIAPRRDGIPMRHALFGVLVVGTGRIGGIPLVACREPLTDGLTPGSSPVRLLPLDFLVEGWQFPHTITAKLVWDWQNQELLLTVRVKDGEPTDPSEIDAIFDSERRSFSFRREGVGIYRYRVPRRDLGHDLPAYTVRLRRDYFRGTGNSEWLTLTTTIR